MSYRDLARHPVLTVLAFLLAFIMMELIKRSSSLVERLFWVAAIVGVAAMAAVAIVSLEELDRKIWQKSIGLDLEEKN